ncbi:S8 family serine peptidase [Nitrosomonas sp.]|uniref:S8 family serine peptidase n=1 Tax=Nitrosomonas sp. TaxID=42353 RepID=UPI00263164A8|nr:S8 family serine peptidase [Nitrosomonas sp.]MCW5601955.1 S8 family serine peptidase [Nitrosomonas sp.]
MASNKHSTPNPGVFDLLILLSDLPNSRYPTQPYRALTAIVLAGFAFLICLATTSPLAAPPERGHSEFAPTSLPEQARAKRNSNDSFARGRILISPRAGLPASALANILKEYDGKARKIGQSNLYIVDLPEYTEEGVMARLTHHPHLKLVELDHYTQPASVPNDPMYGDQWHLPKISAPPAWNLSQGTGVIIAILDSGANSQHQDLADQLVPGWNIWDNNSDTTDLTGHGTRVAGAAAASSNNGMGIAGVAGNSKIMPVRITEPTVGGAYESTITQGLIYAADHGARVANVSFRNVMGSSAKREAAQYMKNKNGLVIVSAGNDGADMGYMDTTTMIVVSATDQNDLKTIFSNYGSYVDLAAPGKDILTTDMDGSYSSRSGTSYSSPITAGITALMMAANPNLSNLDIEALLFSTAVDLGDPGKDVYYGRGRVDAAMAVQAALTALPRMDTESPTVSITEPLGGATVAGLVPVDIEAADNVGVVRAEISVNNTVVAVDTSTPYAFTWDSSSAPNGTVNLVAHVFDAAGNQSSSSVEVNVDNQVKQPSPLTDTTPPVIHIVNPVTGNVSGSVTISVDAEDNEGASGITQAIYIDGSLVATGNGSTLAFNWNTRSKKIAKGAHTIHAVAKDAAGNSSSTSVNVNVIK